jgi:hypothetical protein
MHSFDQLKVRNRPSPERSNALTTRRIIHTSHIVRMDPIRLCHRQFGVKRCRERTYSEAFSLACGSNSKIGPYFRWRVTVFPSRHIPIGVDPIVSCMSRNDYHGVGNSKRMACGDTWNLALFLRNSVLSVIIHNSDFVVLGKAPRNHFLIYRESCAWRCSSCYCR